MKLFDNTEVAFSTKSDVALDRAYFLFKLIAHEPLVRIGKHITQFALKSHLPVEGLIRAAVFDHFCAGTNAQESMQVVATLSEKKVASVLDYSVEGVKAEISFDECLENILETLQLSAKSPHIPFTVFKPSGFGNHLLFEKISKQEKLSPEETLAWGRVRNRFMKCGEIAKEIGMKLLIDAEESWIQPAVNTLVEEMMMKFNVETPIVHTTAQMYLSDKLDYLVYLKNKAEKEGFVAGVKLVRGAYIEKENQYAEENGFKSPICSSKVATDKNFDEGWRYMIANLKQFSIYFGSHNEESTYGIIDEMKNRKINKTHPHIWFGQLYGMSDHISFNLANEGYQVSKYLPFGPVKDVLPYLIRRAEENTAVAGQTIRELELIVAERKRRKLR